MKDPIGFIQVQTLRLCHLLGQKRDITIMPELGHDVPAFLRKPSAPGARVRDIKWHTPHAG